MYIYCIYTIYSIDTVYIYNTYMYINMHTFLTFTNLSDIFQSFPNQSRKHGGGRGSGRQPSNNSKIQFVEIQRQHVFSTSCIAIAVG